MVLKTTLLPGLRLSINRLNYLDYNVALEGCVKRTFSTEAFHQILSTSEKKILAKANT